MTAPAIATGAVHSLDAAHLWFGGGADFALAPESLRRSNTTGAWFGRGLAP